MNRLKSARAEVDVKQRGLFDEAKRLREEKDAAEKRARARTAEIERLHRLHEGLDKREPAQVSCTVKSWPSCALKSWSMVKSWSPVVIHLNGQPPWI